MIRNINLVLMLICLFGLQNVPEASFAQNWPKIYGDNFHASIRKIEETYDHGFLLSAYTYTSAGWPLRDWILKIDINGNVLWNKQFGNGMYSNGVSDSKITHDHGIILAAGTSKYSGNYDPTFIKLNVCGEIEWCKVMLSPDDNYSTGILQLANGSYIGMLQYYGEGETYARISLVKMDQYGEPVWIKRLAQDDSTIYNEEGSFLCHTSDDNLLVTGQCFHPGLQPLWIKTDTSGIQLWDLFWPGGMGVAYQVIEVENGHFYSVGSFAGTNFPFTPTLYKFDNGGNPLSKIYILHDTIEGGEAWSICANSNSEILVGMIWGTDSDPAIYNSEIFLLDTLGNILDRKLLIIEDEPPEYIIKTLDDKILVTGNYVVDNNWDIYLWKLNSDLEFDTIYSQLLTYDSLCPYQIQSDTVDLDCGVFVNIDELPTKEEYESTIKIYPNPASEWVVFTLPEVVSEGAVELVVYDVFGREAWRNGGREAGKRGRGENMVNRMISLDVSGFSSGMYVAVALDKKGRKYTGKFVAGYE